MCVVGVAPCGRHHLPFHRISVRSDEPVIEDVDARTDAALANSGVQLQRGDEVAIAVGSRGLRDLTTIVRRVGQWVVDQGAVEPRNRWT